MIKRRERERKRAHCTSKKERNKEERERERERERGCDDIIHQMPIICFKRMEGRKDNKKNKEGGEKKEWNLKIMREKCVKEMKNLILKIYFKS